MLLAVLFVGIVYSYANASPLTSPNPALYLQVTGKITYCGHEFHDFVPQRTSAYISQHDLHHGEMTVRETLDFAGRCLGVGTRYDLLVELSRREKEAGIMPDPQIDAFMKATAIDGQETSLITDYVLKVYNCCFFFRFQLSCLFQITYINRNGHFLTDSWLRYLC